MQGCVASASDAETEETWAASADLTLLTWLGRVDVALRNEALCLPFSRNAALEADGELLVPACAPGKSRDTFRFLLGAWWLLNALPGLPEVAGLRDAWLRKRTLASVPAFLRPAVVFEVVLLLGRYCC